MIIDCAHCGKPTNDKARHCAHCGGETVKPASRETALCPTCKCPLEEDAYRGSIIDTCPQCHGIWLDTDEFAFHASERDVYSDPEVPRKFTKKPLESKKPYAPCVRCGTLMARRNFRRISGVLIDVCQSHGAWFDAGELEQIRSFIAGGGLDESQDRAIAANSEEIARTAREVKNLGTVFRTMNKFDLKRILLQGF